MNPTQRPDDIPAAPETTTRPYPAEADPRNPDRSEPAEVTGTPTDPLPRELHVDNEQPTDDDQDEPLHPAGS